QFSRAESAPNERLAVAAVVPPLPPVTAAPPLLEAPEPPPPPDRIVAGRLDRGQTLGSALGALGVATEIVNRIDAEMRPLFNFRRARPGHEFWLTLDAAGELMEFRYRTSTTEGFRIVRDGEGFTALHEEIELVPHPKRLAGVVVSTLYKAVTDLGESGQLARDFADVFAWDIDFQRSVQPGDRFQVLYERLYRAEDDGGESYVRPGRILAARYDGTAGSHTAVYFESEEGRGGYYRPDGTSVEGQFLMAPLRHARVSSSYSAARHHPILKITRPHHGIDYAAPTGTPVWAVADGEVIYRARAGGFGNLVKIRHANGYVSYYAHLSRYAKNLKVGQKVGQKQVIGYVGQTGLATGPHVCFRIAKNGQYVNPARLRTPSGRPVPDELQPTFRTASALLMAELDAGTLFAAEDAAL
ncbi:MAG: M23 family metallopeptidase, partial [Myxococcales bacterium]|nr:M23 family metallopeptidase [Myxococcales bacterium]